ncbi:resolvase-like protein [Streptomyces sp. Ag109_O5-1]|uniref:recombinase family protein n=1 Tax=Streptomyces sp. Ag109_O5-1 TaxID=1938851 RepID=UPI000F504FD7|nr:recombinase family protein [Streptomyces sp. Ag109_O5-1]RPE40201.1 resolvase-like protein [Streptomyces sp. Ag109_O5-1]
MPLAPEYLHMVFPQVTFHAWLYGRNSVDPRKKGRSVADQLSEGRGLCTNFGWIIDDEFKDTGISASRHARRSRDDFEALLDTIESADTPPGTMRVLVAYEASRYYRDLEAYVRLRNACYHAGVLLCYNGQVYDLSKREDRKATAMDAIAAEDEGEGIRDRNVRTARLNAEAGGIWGKCPFGFKRKYDPDSGELIGQFEDPVQGAVVIAALQHIDGGGSINSLMKHLKNNPDAVRPDGSEWDEGLIKYMLVNRAYLGERMHHGQSRKAKWDALKELQTTEGRALFRRVTKILTAPDRSIHYDSRAAHLLSHIALCGQCGDGVVLKASKRAGDKKGVYRCSGARDLTIVEETLDAYVEQALMAWLSRKEQARAALVPDQSKERAEVQRAQQLLGVYTEELEEARRLNRTRNEQGRPLLSLTVLSEKELELLPKIEQLEQRLESATGVPLLVQQLLGAADPEEKWEGLSLEQKREALRLLVTVRLFRDPKPGGRGITPGRVGLSFVGSAGFRDAQSRVHASVPAAARAEAAGRE